MVRQEHVRSHRLVASGSSWKAKTPIELGGLTGSRGLDRCSGDPVGGAVSSAEHLAVLRSAIEAQE
jgi:hypothetical protein